MDFKVSHCMHQELHTAHATGLMIGAGCGFAASGAAAGAMQFSPLYKCNPVYKYGRKNIMQSLFMSPV